MCIFKVYLSLKFETTNWKFSTKLSNTGSKKPILELLHNLEVLNCTTLEEDPFQNDGSPSSLQVIFPVCSHIYLKVDMKTKYYLGLVMSISQNR